MRYGVISDVHGNLPALERVLDALRRAAVDRVLCLGDLVGYGPSPNACVARVAELDCIVVAGNHDLMAVDRLEDHGSPLARLTMDWTRSVLGEDARTYIEALPLRREVGSEIVMTHGALGDPGRYVWRSKDAAAQLDELGRVAPGADLLLLGHTHSALAYGRSGGTRLAHRRGRVALAASERFLLNPGSVGQSRQWSGTARFLVLDLEQRSAQFDAVRYDATMVRAELRRHGLPAKASHRRPTAWRAARRLGHGLLARSSAPVRRRWRRRASERGG